MLLNINKMRRRDGWFGGVRKKLFLNLGFSANLVRYHKI